MKSTIYSLLAILLILTSCDDTTEGLGTSINDSADNLNVSSAIYGIASNSILCGDVVSRSSIGYLGRVKDAETGVSITSDFMTQFHVLTDYEFPTKKEVVSMIDGEVVADSCEVRVFMQSFYGDSLATMKCTLHELDRPLKASEKYPSSFSPIKEGYVREDGIHQQKTYTIADYSITDYDRWTNVRNIRISLNKPYTDKAGKTYNNYGSYVMNKFYENKAFFHNSYAFTNNVCPGFLLESTSGIGSMAYTYLTQLNVYFRYETTDSASNNYVDKYVKEDGKKYYVYNGIATFAGTEEVLQKTFISQDKGELENLVKDNSCTYLKTPAGVLTQVTLPVDDILKGHENDTLNAASIKLMRENNISASEYSFSSPSTVMILPSDSVDSFFANKKVADYRTSFITTFSSSTNSYTFGNIASLIRFMAEKKAEYLEKNPGVSEEQYAILHPNWNKATIVPVTTSYATVNSSSVLSSVSYDMSITSTRLERGTEGNDSPIKLSVIYSKFDK